MMKIRLNLFSKRKFQSTTRLVLKRTLRVSLKQKGLSFSLPKLNRSTCNRPKRLPYMRTFSRSLRILLPLRLIKLWWTNKSLTGLPSKSKFCIKTVTTSPGQVKNNKSQMPPRMLPKPRWRLPIIKLQTHEQLQWPRDLCVASPSLKIWLKQTPKRRKKLQLLPCLSKQKESWKSLRMK